VANVQFIVAGNDIAPLQRNVGPVLMSPPYTTVWDSTTVADGSYALYAVAQDTSGNYGTSSIHIIVNNPGGRRTKGSAFRWASASSDEPIDTIANGHTGQNKKGSAGDRARGTVIAMAAFAVAAFAIAAFAVVRQRRKGPRPARTTANPL
jgi:hypothetical protein